MSEVFGIVAGAASLVQFLEVIRKSFDAINQARNFDSDYLGCLLRLSICHLRFKRWNTIANLETEPRFYERLSSYDTGTLGVEDILRQLNTLFARALKIARHSVPVKLRSASTSDSDQPSLTHEIRELVIALQQRKEAPSREKVRKVVSWVFHRYKALKEVTVDIEKMLDSMEKVCPPNEDRSRKMAEDEVERIAKVTGELELILKIAQSTDPKLGGAAAQRVDSAHCGGRTVHQQLVQDIDIEGAEGGRTVVGNVVSKDFRHTDAVATMGSQRVEKLNGKNTKNMTLVIGNVCGEVFTKGL